ncbi:hypothetical protein GIB67_011456 [Kingdonia uniflora]|uniref:Uncharacterized protein n=1 Tax=Kingdonia uniflora TaxID=39325 RepID=A0A7J7NLG6_9MAGN|nr:hypothetical protein GIB67_011456 [Kingdonia uniflora]
MKAQRVTPASSSSISTNLEAGSNKFAFANITTSPLRKFQLIDTDSDEPSANGDRYVGIYKVNASATEKQSNPTSQSVTTNQQMKAKISINNLQNQRQFGQGGNNTQYSNAKGSNKGRETSRNSNASPVSEPSRSWLNPKNCPNIPKDAGKRRVHADGQSSSHWYTGQGGKKVYVTKAGQELAGQNAYRHYRKESRGGFKRSRKNATTSEKMSKR